MKKYILMTIFLFFSFSSFAAADDFLGAPILSGGKILNKTDSRLEMTTDMTHDQVLAFYKAALNGQSDIKFRDWKDSTYIEDDGKLDWHSITISKTGYERTNIIIAKDSWTWIIGTLILRFIGVFIVLIILYIGMSISGRILSRTLAK